MRPPRNTGSRTVWSWALYDFANSAYILTTATAVLPLYFSGVIVPQNGARILGQTLEAPTIWGLLVGAAALAIFILAPILGAVADASGRARTLLGLFALGGASAGLGVSQSGPGDVLWAASLFILAQVCFAGANVFYDAFLPHIAAPKDRDRVSGLGFAAGYLGGGLQFAISLGLISGRDALGLTFAQAAQWSMALAAAWWAVFTLPSLAGLGTLEAKRDEPGLIEAAHRLGVALTFYDKEALETVAVPNPSARVRERMGVDSVCEAAAILTSSGRLLVQKTSAARVTVAVAVAPSWLPGSAPAAASG